ncbi:MAG: SGNH/GDSL hydrolase family protein [Alphaproteobacteria bacterium]|nr:SGNH/GDSL hydrolase family protein [Alphaproteobacteria bacterium]
MEKRIGFIGDSVTAGYCDETGAGWAGRLSQKIGTNYPNKYFFYNLSEGGDRICDAYHHVCSEVVKKDTDILIIAIGINDIVHRSSPDEQCDLSEFLRKKYWQKLFEITKKLKIKTVVLDILPVIEEEAIYDDEPSLYNFNEDVKKYNQILKELCQQNGASFIERFELWETRNLENLYVDTVHPAGTAHQLIADEVYEGLLKNKIL